MNGEVPTLNAEILRRLGETADGNRDTDMLLVRRRMNDETTHEVISADEMNTDGAVDEVLAHVRTNTFVPDRIPIERVRITTEHGQFDVCQDFDAIFWTESSVEKFVFPYYEHLRIFDEDYLRGLKRDFRDREIGRRIVAIGHRNPSRSIFIKGGCAPSSEPPSRGTVMYFVPDGAEQNDNNPWMHPETFRQIFRR